MEGMRLPSAGIRHQGSLTSLGYNLHEGEEARQSALNKAVRKYGYRKTQEKLAALEGLNKNHPEYHHKVQMDIDYVRMHHEDISPKA